jgi:hypothetical protein
MDRDIPENDEAADEHIRETEELEADIQNLNMADIS